MRSADDRKHCTYTLLGTVWLLISTKIKSKHRSSIYFLCGGKN